MQYHSHVRRYSRSVEFLVSGINRAGTRYYLFHLRVG